LTGLNRIQPVQVQLIVISAPLAIGHRFSVATGRCRRIGIVIIRLPLLVVVRQRVQLRFIRLFMRAIALVARLILLGQRGGAGGALFFQIQFIRGELLDVAVFRVAARVVLLEHRIARQLLGQQRLQLQRRHLQQFQ